MKVRNYLCLSLLAFSFTACGSATDTTDLPVDEILVGTNIGTPIAPVTKMLFQLESSTAADDDTSNNSLRQKSWCTSMQKINGELTNICKLTTQEYQIGVLAIYATTCKNSSGETVKASSADLANCDTQTELYSGDIVNLSISSAETAFSQPLPAFNVSQAISGIQFVMAYVGQRFPTLEEDEFNAERIQKQLRGKSFRICTSPTPTTADESAKMKALCGDEQSQTGDFLIDMNDDGIFGFIDLTVISAIGEIAETDVRDAQYSEFMKSRLQELASTDKVTAASTSFTSDTFYGTPGYYAALYSLGEVTTVQADSDSSFHVIFDMQNTFRFVDGAIHDGTDENILSKGIYNPWDDYAVVIAFPQADVTLGN